MTKKLTHPQFQADAYFWATQCFGPEAVADQTERAHRFTEEALELVQSVGCSREEVLLLVDYVFSRPIGELKQEVGGVMNTLGVLCESKGVDMYECAEEELDRCWANFNRIRAKHLAKPKFSPLPGAEDGASS